MHSNGNVSHSLGRKIVALLLNLRRTHKRLLALTVDAVLCVTTVFVALYLRLGYWMVPQGAEWLAVIASLVFALPLLISFGLYRAVFRYSDGAAMATVAKAAFIYGIAYSGIFTVIGVAGIPRTLGLIQPLLLFPSILATRAFARMWLGEGYRRLSGLQVQRRVVIYGAGSAGRQLAAALGKSSEMRVIFFVDDDQSLHGGVLNGLKIYGAEELPSLIEKYSIDDLLLAMPSSTRKKRNQIVELVLHCGVVVRILPGLDDIAHGRVAVSDLRELQIEDLMGRDAVAPNEILMSRHIVGRTTLVSGAGGSIGSELCRQIIRRRPACLLLVEISESALYEIHQELLAIIADEMVGSTIEVVPLLASAADAVRIGAIISAWRPDTIYHAAAYKHVPLVEHNPLQGLLNNVIGTLVLAKAAHANSVTNFVLISTDKAVRPTNVMGASKRLAELVLQALAREASLSNFSMVRFGNVLGSSGSVVPLFRKQISQGGPVTITHSEMTRFFMTIPEASQLVIQAGAMASGGEVFVLDMGEPVKIVDMARRMIELSGLTERTIDQADGDIEIEFVGLRPGEKLYEELLIGDDVKQTTHPRIMQANEHSLPLEELAPKLDELVELVANSDVDGALALLQELVREYSPAPGSVDWIKLTAARSKKPF